MIYCLLRYYGAGVIGKKIRIQKNLNLFFHLFSSSNLKIWFSHTFVPAVTKLQGKFTFCTTIDTLFGEKNTENFNGQLVPKFSPKLEIYLRQHSDVHSIIVTCKSIELHQFQIWYQKSSLNDTAISSQKRCKREQGKLAVHVIEGRNTNQITYQTPFQSLQRKI